MIEFERRRRHVHEINLTALIDIVFHLMVFVMLTTSFVVSESMELSLPGDKASNATPASTATVRLQIEPDGMILTDAGSLNPEQVSALLANELGASPETKIAIFTTPGVSVQQLVSLLDTVYLTGGHNVQVNRAR
jgi:biopolymer transport protein ExbD